MFTLQKIRMLKWTRQILQYAKATAARSIDCLSVLTDTISFCSRNDSQGSTLQSESSQKQHNLAWNPRKVHNTSLLYSSDLPLPLSDTFTFSYLLRDKERQQETLTASEENSAKHALSIYPFSKKTLQLLYYLSLKCCTMGARIILSLHIFCLWYRLCCMFVYYASYFKILFS